MRRLPRATWIPIMGISILTILAGVMASVGAPALTWLPPKVALGLLVPIGLLFFVFSLWQAKQNPASSLPAADANRQIMLGRVQNKWITGFLENPLYYSYDEQLLLVPLRERVGSRFDLVLSNPLKSTKTIPPSTTLAQVFKRARGELLILGEPGAGKTTLLLELARDLLKRAKDNPRAPIPVVLMLSSWATRKLPLEQWIVEELKLKYDIPFQIGEAWVKANQLLLLLDGLDEVAPSALPVCIEAINEYYHQARRSLVVCSRTKEFLGQPGRLALHRAVTVQPLSPEQVDTYLDGLAAKGEDIEGLQQALHQSAALRELATTPFFLTVLILAYHGKPAQELLALEKATPTEQSHLLFHNYVERVLQREGARIRASAQQTKHWLVWLARQMTARQQSELYLEQFQPDWLSKRQRAFYQWSMRLVAGQGVGLLGGLVAGQGVGLFFGLFFGLVAGLIAGLFFGLVYMLVVWREMKIKPAEAFTWSWKRFVLGQGVGLIAGLIVGLLSGLFVGLFHGRFVGLYVERSTGQGTGQGFGLIVGLLGGLFGWLFVGLIFGLLGGFSGKQLTERSILFPNEGIRRSIKNGLIFGLPFGVIGGLIFGLIGRQSFGLVGGLIFGLVVGLIFGLVGGRSFGLGAATLQPHLINSTFEGDGIPMGWDNDAP